MTLYSGLSVQSNDSFRCTRAAPGPRRYVIGNPPRHALGASGPVSAASSGCASAYEIGITGIFMMVIASLRSSRFAPGTAPMPGVSGSPGYVGMSSTLPRCTPSFGRNGPAGYVSPAPKPSSRGSE